MKTLFLYLLFSTLSLVALSQPTIKEIRDAFFRMEEDSCSALSLFESIKSNEYPNAIMQAYAGATEAASAQCVKGAFNKLEYFSRGKKNLEAAIEKEPEDAEVRFLRFATQVNAPNFLEYDNKKEDVNFIFENLPELLKDNETRAFWEKASQALFDSGYLSGKQNSQLKEIMGLQ